MLPLKNTYLVALIIASLLVSNSESAEQEYFQYIFPYPASFGNSIQSTLIYKLHDYLPDKLELKSFNIEVHGESSGSHPGKFVRADNKTIIYKPFQHFALNEKVHVNISFELNSIPISMQYYFVTSNVESDHDILTHSENQSVYGSKTGSLYKTYGKRTSINGVSVPGDFPIVDVNIGEGIASGKIFLSTWNEYPFPYIMILNNNGTPYFYQRLKERSLDFKLQPGGTLTRWEEEELNAFIEMDSAYKTIDTLRCGHGYGTDSHDVQILSNGNILLIGDSFTRMDMSQLVEGGDPNALVRGNHILEMDRNDNVIFEWRCWDYFNVLDVLHENLTAGYIDFVHMNAIAIDYDGNILASSRSLSEVTKINRSTGDIVWRLGGKNNQFDFVNDAYGISRQHDIRPVPGKENHYTIFDNGNYYERDFTRVIEFVLDTISWTATKVWEYRHDPDWFSIRAGNAQRLPNGNTLINWTDGSLPKAMEVTPEGEVVYELNFVSEADCYRSFRFEWEGIKDEPYLIAESYPDRVSLSFNKFGDTDVTGYVIYADKNPDPTIAIDTTVNTWLDLTDLDNYEDYYFRVTALNSSGEESTFSNQENVFVRYVDSNINLILNGDFTDEDLYWNVNIAPGASADILVETESYHVLVDDGGTDYDDIQIIQSGIPLIQGKWYSLEFDGWSDNDRLVEPKLESSSSSYEDYCKIGLIYLTAEPSHFRFEFEMKSVNDLNVRFILNCGYESENIYLDNITLKEMESTDIRYGNIHKIDKYELFDNYPNPFNPATIINYQIPARSAGGPMINEVELSIYNVLGQKVATLVSEKQKAGYYHVEWDASPYAAGVYYYQLKAGSDFVQTKKLVFLK